MMYDILCMMANTQTSTFRENSIMSFCFRGLVAEKTDDQLFFIDTPADVNPEIDTAADGKTPLREFSSYLWVSLSLSLSLLEGFRTFETWHLR